MKCLPTSAVTAVLMVSCAPGVAQGQQLTSPSEWMNKLDREHNHMVTREGHVHARGQVEAVDPRGVSVTIVTEQMASADRTIWMPAMKMVFHVTKPRNAKRSAAGRQG